MKKKEKKQLKKAISKCDRISKWLAGKAVKSLGYSTAVEDLSAAVDEFRVMLEDGLYGIKNPAKVTMHIKPASPSKLVGQAKTTSTPKKRRMSDAGRKAIAAAQKKRWANHKKTATTAAAAQ